MKVNKVFIAAALSLWVCLTTPSVAQDKIPAFAEIPPILTAEDQSALNRAKADLEDNYLKFKSAADHFSAKSAENQSDEEFEALQDQKRKHIKAVLDFNEKVHKAHDQRVVRGITALAKKHNWPEKQQTRLAIALRDLKSAGDPDTTNVQIYQAWGSILARKGDEELEKAVSAGDGPGFPGAGRQNGEDCAIFALANATGSPYSVIAALAIDMIRDSDWHSEAARAAPEKVVTEKGLNGGEVLMLACRNLARNHGRFLKFTGSSLLGKTAMTQGCVNAMVTILSDEGFSSAHST